MTEQEAKDLEDMKKSIIELKISRLDYIMHLAKCSEEQLMHSGHRFGQARAVLDSINVLKKDIEKIIDAYIKKYPD